MIYFIGTFVYFEFKKKYFLTLSARLYLCVSVTIVQNNQHRSIFFFAIIGPFLWLIVTFEAAILFFLIPFLLFKINDYLAKKEQEIFFRKN